MVIYESRTDKHPWFGPFDKLVNGIYAIILAYKPNKAKWEAVYRSDKKRTTEAAISDLYEQFQSEIAADKGKSAKGYFCSRNLLTNSFRYTRERKVKMDKVEVLKWGGSREYHRRSKRSSIQ